MDVHKEGGKEGKERGGVIDYSIEDLDCFCFCL